MRCYTTLLPECKLAISLYLLNNPTCEMYLLWIFIPDCIILAMSSTLVLIPLAVSVIYSVLHVKSSRVNQLIALFVVYLFNNLLCSFLKESWSK